MAILMIGLFAAWLVSVVRVVPPPPVVEYDGEFDDGFLATKGWFSNDFSERTDCNITSDILGGGEGTAYSCVYETVIDLNDTAVPSASSKDYEFSWVVDIDGPVESMDVDFELKDDGDDYFTIKDAGIYTHEDEPTEVFDLKPYVEDLVEIDATTDALDGDEYVIWIKLHSKDIDEKFSDAEKFGVLNLKLDTDEDVDEAYATLINEET
ncbi:MAG: hypothetical protein ACE5KD_00560 [Candidatus Bathyarchaeia archaeon]